MFSPRTPPASIIGGVGCFVLVELSRQFGFRVLFVGIQIGDGVQGVGRALPYLHHAKFLFSSILALFI